MNQDIIQGKWHEIKGALRENWGRLTDDDLIEIDGSREKLSGKIQRYYGLAQDEVERQLRKWESDRAA